MLGKRLIVNADDFNTDVQRNCGILEAASRGIVTSVSVLANSSLLETNREIFASVKTLGVGVHLNLTKGYPLCRATKSLCDNNGQFFSKESAWRRALARRFDPWEVKQEFSAQISRILAAGITPDHLDGNNQLHVFPHLSEVAAEVAVEFGISSVRVPHEPFAKWSDCFRSHGLKKAFFAFLSRRAALAFKRRGLKFPDYFAGIQHPRPGDRVSLQRFLRTLPEGVTELMCHPGYAHLAASFSTKERERELGALTSPEVRKAVAEAGILLSTFRDL